MIQKTARIRQINIHLFFQLSVLNRPDEVVISAPTCCSSQSIKIINHAHKAQLDLCAPKMKKRTQSLTSVWELGWII